MYDFIRRVRQPQRGSSQIAARANAASKNQAALRKQAASKNPLLVLTKLVP